MKNLDQVRTAESKDSRTSGYEPPSIAIIGALEEITLGALSKNGDPGGTGKLNP